MGGLSSDPAKRANQLANLKRGGTIAPLGNRRSRKHGAYATIAIERLDAKTREVLDALADDLPLRDSDGSVPASDVPLLRLLADVLCRLDDIGAWLSAHGWQDAKGEPRQVVDVESRLRREAATYLEALGCSPASRVRLGWVSAGDVCGDAEV
jgi:hypothetical protein